MVDDTSKEPARGDEVVAVPLDQVRQARGQKVVAVRRSKLAGLKAFRRTRADRVWGAIGVAAIILAAYLLFSWERPPPEEVAWPVDWEERMVVVENETTARLSEPGAANPVTGQAPQTTRVFEFDLDRDNMTRVEVVFSFIDDVGSENPASPGADQFNVTIEAPAEVNRTIEKASVANATMRSWDNFTIGLNEIPTIAKAPGAKSPDDAHRYLAENVNASTLGKGTWRVTVRMMLAGDAWNGDAIGNPSGGSCDPINEQAGRCRVDSGNDFTLSIRYYYYEPVVPETKEPVA